MKIKKLCIFICTLLLTAEMVIIFYQQKVINNKRGITAANIELKTATLISDRQSPISTSNMLEADVSTRDSIHNRMGDRFRHELLNPVFLHQLSIVQKQWIVDHYSKLFLLLNLKQSEKENFIELIAEKQLAKADAASAIEAIGGTQSPLSLIEDAQKGINKEIEQLLGSEKYQTYYDFEMTDGLRTTLIRLQEMLAYTSDPISDSAIEPMVQILDKSIPANKRGGIAKFTGASPLVASGLVTPPFSSPLPANAASLLDKQLSTSQLDQLKFLMKQQSDEWKYASAMATVSRSVNQSSK